MWLELAKQALLFGVPGTMILAGSIALIADIRARWTWQRTTGRVVGHEERPDTEDPKSLLYRSIVEFDENGETHRLVDFSAYGWKFDKLGSEVTVHFPADAPDRARIVRTWPAVACLAIVIVGSITLTLVITRR